MQNLIIPSTNNTNQIQGALQNYEQDINNLNVLNYHMYNQIDKYDRNIIDLENSNFRYWDAQANFNQIMNNEARRYDYLKNKEQYILQDINKLFQTINLYRFKDKFYFKKSEFVEWRIYTKEELEKEISSRYLNINIQLVNDLNDVLSYKKMEFRIDTTYIAISSIPIVDDEVFDIYQSTEVFRSFEGSIIRNKLLHNYFLFNRLLDFNLNENYISHARYFIQSMTTIKNLKFLSSRLGNFFKHLNSSNTIILVGNKDVSRNILIQKILKPIFGSQYFITITDEMLEKMSIEEIIQYKLIYHIDYIPQNEKNRDKLKEILISILVNKSIEIGNKFIPIHGQVIFTVDKEDVFFKDFLSSSDVFFIDSIENIMFEMGISDKITLYKNIQDSLEDFSKELSAIGNLPFAGNEFNTYNKKFAELLNEIDEENLNLLKRFNHQPILDPFDNSFEILIPTHERFMHTYITGQSGSGKSELLKSIVYSNILRNDGVVILLEPHGDLSKDVAKLPIDKNQLIYIEPSLQDGMTPTLNLFDLEDKCEKNIQKVAKVIVSVIKSVNDDEKFSGAMEEMTYYCCCLLLRKGDSDFFELSKLLNDKKNTELLKLVKNSPDSLEREYFEDYFKNSKPTQDAVKRRVSKILKDSVLQNLLNGSSTFNLEKAMNTQGNVIIFRIQKEEMLESYIYYARFIVGLIQIIALKRANIDEKDRVKTYCHIDEFHNFITPAIEEILTESRKYKLYLTLAHQSISQIRNTALKDIILSNTNIKLIGKNSNKTLEALNSTLNIKLEDVEKLATGEFYLSVGANDIIKITNSDSLLNGKEDISDAQWGELKEHQLKKYYRSIDNFNRLVVNTEELNQKIDEFIHAIKSINISYFDNVKDNLNLYDELIFNFNDESNNVSGYISKQDMYLYFNLIYGQNYFSNNKDLLKLLKKDNFFKQDVNSNKTSNGKKRYFIA
ncbi:type IV secretory system conjugative DNA transfer family protein [Aliarcobacter cryaerophilus]|uniref:type IV secretory system conjugative DNA transfer family protein n=1 Tax=Aliarcobacter cryaerophilus TaxID=28198 RepID=UPI0021B590CD|nr:type IV secretory system conjugative DNA transfer family protein [Aliarcobacter cryaerophilus]MCT7473647.1 type IV secretion system DNA-binding domain-containing protein [Aliarcobacter cryaerophilus]